MKSIFKLLPIFLFVINIHAANAAPQGSGLLLTMPPLLAAQNTLPPGTVRSAGGRIWMDRNLGASRLATHIDDSGAFGFLYQWGRLSDGHQNRSSSITNSTSNKNVPGHGNFILAPSDGKFDWRVPQNNSLWQGVNGVNNPCPQGFRLPTQAEWQREIDSWSSNDAHNAFKSPLKLTMAGVRIYNDGFIVRPGSYGSYATSTVYSVGSDFFELGGLGGSIAKIVGGGPRGNGRSVRCIMD